MVVWREPPMSVKPYDDVHRELHENPNQWGLIWSGIVIAKAEKSRIRVKWAQALRRRCELCRIKASTEGEMYSIYAKHEGEL